MAPHAPSDQALHRARVSWLQSVTDYRSAQKRRRQRAYLESAYLSFQSALNALSAVCHAHRRYQIPNFSTVQLAALCEEFDARFADVREACAALEKVQDYSPFAQGATGHDRELARVAQAALRHAGLVHKAVRAFLKENRKRFFAP
ncbi:MAG TPA: hypothetical protein VL359_09405 [bacterium]|nr:hypothetical protein [bacterium]